MSHQPSLNPSQQAAVEHDIGPMLVLAGAGSGKTRVVTTRIARLIARGVAAHNILAMTFTNKAAREMRERVIDLVGAKLGKELMVSTFHSFGLMVLSSEAARLGFRHGQFTIFDQADVFGAIREILRDKRADRRYDVGAIAARISLAKNAFLEESELLEREGDEYDEVAKLVWPRYRAALKGFHAVDFDDLVCEPVRLMQRDPHVLAKWRERYRYLLVDEYQDTNRSQLELVRLLGGEHRNVCVVGDDDQSIYAWRGADMKNILDFERHFPGAKVVKLEDNYRSTAAVLNVANAVLGKSQARRHPKVLRAAREAGAPVELVVASDSEVEAAFIGDEIRRLSEQGIARREIAVLYRSNLQAEPIETALKERAIPFCTVGGTQFYERKEVKDLLAYLKVALNPRDEIALRRVINYPARGIGEVTLERLEAAAVSRNRLLWDVIARAEAIEGLAPAAVEGCHKLVSVVGEARRRLEASESPAVVARALAEGVGLRADIDAGSASNSVAARRWGNVESLLGVFTRHHERGAGRPSPLERFGELVRFLTLDPPEDEEQAKNFVTLTTMHAAKGLEYSCVFVAGLEEGLMPHQRVLDPRATDAGLAGMNDIEEERRLFYVSITRAKDRLYLCRAKMRLLRGKPTPRTPSRFVCDIPSELLVVRDIMAAAPPAAQNTAVRGAALLAALDGSTGPVARQGVATAARPAEARARRR